MKLAIIDIGSNSVRLMLSANGKTLYKRVTTTRLGEGLEQSPFLSDIAIERTISAVDDFVKTAKAEGATVYAFATAAVRSAKNGDEFVGRVYRSCGIQVEVISGTNEAKLGILGALGHCDGGMIDIGGASTEVFYQKDGRGVFSVSIPLGAVRLYDRCLDDLERLTEAICGELGALEGVIPVGTTYAIGGTASTLASVCLSMREYDAFKLQDCVLSVKWIEKTARKLSKMTLNERKVIAGMDERRADIIVGGTQLLAEIMKKLGLSEVKFSDKDNLEGYCLFKHLCEDKP